MAQNDTDILYFNSYPTSITDSQNVSFAFKKGFNDAITIRIRSGTTTIVQRTGLLSGKNTQAGGTLSYTFTLTEAERNTLRSGTTGKSRTLNFYAYYPSLGGDADDYAAVRNFTYNVVDASPTFNEAIPLTYEDTNAAGIAITGDNQKIIQNVSNLVAHLIGAATAKKYAAIANYKIQIGTEILTVTPDGAADFDTVNLSEDTPITVTVTDSRGYTATYSRNVSILPWQPPRAVVSAVRVNNFEAETTVKADVTIDPLDGGNSITDLKIRYKKTDDVTWSEKALTSGIEDEIIIDNLFQWNVQFVISDEFGTSTYNLLVSKGIPIIFIDNQKLSVGIGKFPETDEALEVDDQYLVPLMKKVYEIGDIIVTTSATNPQDRPQLNGTVWTAWGTGRVPVGVDIGQTEFNTVEKTGGHKLMQSHNHGGIGSFGFNLINDWGGATVRRANMDEAGSGFMILGSTDTNDISWSSVTGSRGGGSGENMPPYITVYMWKRTA